MTREEIRRKVFLVVKETFSTSLLSDKTIIEADFIPDNWDKTMFAINIETMFNIDITDEEENKLISIPLKDVVEYIEQRIGAK